MGKYFGTDGVRGVANQELTPELAFQLGRYGAHVITKGKQQAQVVIGRDTRLSGEMLEAALSAGFLSMGMDVIRLGVVSTPAVAYLTRYLEADAGVMISASHNPYPDNGIKFFNADGFKLSDETEAEIEQYLINGSDDLVRPIGADLGRIIEQPAVVEKYLQFLASTIDTDLTGLHVVVDGANGSAYQLAPQLLQQLGVRLTLIHTKPDGININEGCGSTHPEHLQQIVVEQQADLGIAFDGDADRLIAVDETGQVIDGDQIMYICGTYLHECGKLKNNTIVTTVMSNIGFFKALESQAIHSVRTKVGDRYVCQALCEGGYSLGGEQSGHLIFMDYNTTGDGLLSAIQLLQVIKSKQKSLAKLSQQMTKFPQLMVNVRVHSKAGWDENPTILASIAEVEKQLGSDGRVLVRPSGTEPLIRVMAEGPDEQKLKQYVHSIAQVIEQEQS